MKFKLKTITRSTGPQASELTNKIVDVVLKADYKIVSQNKNTVQFKFRYSFWQNSYRFTHYRKLDGGEITVLSESDTVAFSFYCNLDLYVLFILISLGIGIAAHNSFLGAVIFILVLAIVRIVISKSIAGQMVNDILGNQN